MRYIIIIILFSMFISVQPIGAEENFVPWDFDKEKKIEQPKSISSSLGAAILRAGLKLYRATVSQVDGDRCQMYPSCSAYALDVVNTHGFFIGFTMTAARLIGESNEMDYAPLIKMKNGKELYYDPVSANDFWWLGKPGKD